MGLRRFDAFGELDQRGWSSRYLMTIAGRLPEAGRVHRADRGLPGVGRAPTRQSTPRSPARDRHTRQATRSLTRRLQQTEPLDLFGHRGGKKGAPARRRDPTKRSTRSTNSAGKTTWVLVSAIDIGNPHGHICHLSYHTVQGIVKGICCLCHPPHRSLCVPTGRRSAPNAPARCCAACRSPRGGPPPPRRWRHGRSSARRRERSARSRSATIRTRPPAGARPRLPWNSAGNSIRLAVRMLE